MVLISGSRVQSHGPTGRAWRSVVGGYTTYAPGELVFDLRARLLVAFELPFSLLFSVLFIFPLVKRSISEVSFS